ncbi:hypothetical protein CLOM_g18163, partial [Closterium sp. NIES-68]
LFHLVWLPAAPCLLFPCLSRVLDFPASLPVHSAVTRQQQQQQQQQQAFKTAATRSRGGQQQQKQQLGQRLAS